MIGDQRPTILLQYDSGDGVLKTFQVDGENTWPNMFDEFWRFLLAIGFSVEPGCWVEDDRECDCEK